MCNIFVLTREAYLKLNINALLEKIEASLTSFSGHSFSTDGMVAIPLKTQWPCNDLVKVCVMNRKAPTILEADTCRKLDMVICMNAI